MDINKSEQYTSLDISLKIGNIDKKKSHLQNQNIIQEDQERG